MLNFKLRVKKKSRRQINDSKKQYMQQRRSRVSPTQYTKVKVRGDGHCLFRANQLSILQWNVSISVQLWFTHQKNGKGIPVGLFKSLSYQKI